MMLQAAGLRIPYCSCKDLEEPHCSPELAKEYPEVSKSSGTDGSDEWWNPERQVHGRLEVPRERDVRPEVQSAGTMTTSPSSTHGHGTTSTSQGYGEHSERAIWERTASGEKACWRQGNNLGRQCFEKESGRRYV